ncbi:MAG TPA: hypothetical protein VK559_13320 [Ferruginibacter sp.]|nr:hypothetical protein [Ferruginibacter sp.]
MNMKLCKKYAAIVFILVFFVNCSRYHSENHSNNNSWIHDSSITYFPKYDTLSIGYFNNTFYQLLNKIDSPKNVTAVISNNQLAYLFRNDTLFCPVLNQSISDFFSFSKSDSNKVIVYVITEEEDKSFFVFMEKINRNSLDSIKSKLNKPQTVTYWRSSTSTTTDAKYSGSRKKDDNKKFLTLFFKWNWNRYAVLAN